MIELQIERLNNILSKDIRDHDKYKKIGVLLGTGLDYESVVGQIQSAKHIVTIQNICYDSDLSIYIIFDDIILFIFQKKIFAYENKNAIEVSSPIYLLNKVGVKDIILTGAVGALHDKPYKECDIVLLDDIINLTGDNPLIYMGIPTNEKFIDMYSIFNKKMIDSFYVDFYSNGGYNFHRTNMDMYTDGIYVGINGPSLETRSEYKMYRNYGNLIGMSLIHETIMAKKLYMNILAVCYVTDLCGINTLKPVDINKIYDNCANVSLKIRRYFLNFFNNYYKG